MLRIQVIKEFFIMQYLPGQRFTLVYYAKIFQSTKKEICSEIFQCQIKYKLY